MKKVLCLMSFVLVMGFSVSAFAAATSGLMFFGNGLGQAPTSCSYGLSHNVYMDYTPGNSNQDYALGRKHRGGNREFYTTNMTSNIFYYESDDYKGATTLQNFGSVSAGATTLGGTAL
jgi:hypothetical protein